MILPISKRWKSLLTWKLVRFENKTLLNLFLLFCLLKMNPIKFKKIFYEIPQPSTTVTSLCPIFPSFHEKFSSNIFMTLWRDLSSKLYQEFDGEKIFVLTPLMRASDLLAFKFDGNFLQTFEHVLQQFNFCKLPRAICEVDWHCCGLTRCAGDWTKSK